MSPLSGVATVITFLAGVSLSVAVAFGLAMAVVSALLDRTVSWWEGLLLLAGLFGLQAIAISALLRGGAGLYFGILLAQLCAYLLMLHLGRRASQRAMQRMDLEDMDRYRQAIEFDERNAAAHANLADCYRKLGYYDLAITEYEASLKLDPTQLPEQKKLEATVADRARLGSRQMPCPHCHQPMPAVARRCLSCGLSYDTLDFVSYWLSRARRRRGLLPLALVVFGAALTALVLWLAKR